MRSSRLKKVKAKVLALIFTLIVVIPLYRFSLVAYAAKKNVQVPRPLENVFVYDAEGIISDSVENELNYLLVELERKTSIEFVVVTTKSFNGETLEDYANILFNELGIGKADKDNGILFLMSQEEGQARLEIGYGLEDILIDSKCGRILNTFYKNNLDDSQAAYQTVCATILELGREYDIPSIPDSENIRTMLAENEREEFIEQVILIIIIIIIVIFLKVKFDIDILDILLILSSSSSRSGLGGGSFGGGRSGGGGASSRR